VHKPGEVATAIEEMTKTIIETTRNAQLLQKMQRKQAEIAQ
jgi:hypothetical protein